MYFLFNFSCTLRERFVRTNTIFRVANVAVEITTTTIHGAAKLGLMITNFFFKIFLSRIQIISVFILVSNSSSSLRISQLGRQLQRIFRTAPLGRRLPRLGPPKKRLELALVSCLAVWPSVHCPLSTSPHTILSDVTNHATLSNPRVARISAAVLHDKQVLPIPSHNQPLFSCILFFALLPPQHYPFASALPLFEACLRASTNLKLLGSPSQCVARLRIASP